MPRHRSRSRSYSPGRRSRTPPRGRKRYDEEDRHRDTRSYRDRRSPAPSGLLIRNLPLDARPEDLRGPFEKFGPLKDIYLPKNYYTGEPRGFGFVKYRYGEDAAEAKKRMDHKIIGGREIRIVFAEENRKTPQEMRRTPRTSDRHGGSHGGRTPPRSPRHRYRSYSRSPSPARHDSRFDFICSLRKNIKLIFGPRKKSSSKKESYSKDRGVKEDYCSPRRSRSISRSRSPRDERDFQEDQRSLSPSENGRNPKERNHASRGSRTLRANSRSPSRSHSQSHGSR
ncbi:serine/arginine-rich SC35-like splicing factor SCL28 [Populus alba x Populus x berolinensis]|nr:serine/arginine-rich SC35-like splicing factor SCL28 [Populus alba x Populus x berolinensis]